MPSLDDAFLRLHRAEEHLRELSAVASNFMSDEVERAHIQLQPEPGVPFVFGRADSPVPARISILAGDAIQDLRTSLDYLVYQLAMLDSGVEQTGTQFPIDDNPETFRNRTDATRRFGAHLRGVSPQHAAVIEALQPFRGQGWIRALRELSNEDKHRRLAVHVQNTELQWEPLIDPPGAAEVDVDGGKIEVRGKGEEPFVLHLRIWVEPFVAFENGRPVVATLWEIYNRVWLPWLPTSRRRSLTTRKKTIDK